MIEMELVIAAYLTVV